MKTNRNPITRKLTKSIQLPTGAVAAAAFSTSDDKFIKYWRRFGDFCLRYRNLFTNIKSFFQ